MEYFGTDTLKLSDRNNSIYKYTQPEIPETSQGVLPRPLETIDNNSSNDE